MQISTHLRLFWHSFRLFSAGLLGIFAALLVVIAASSCVVEPAFAAEDSSPQTGAQPSLSAQSNTVLTAQSATYKNMYRLYNPYTYDHLYTADISEAKAAAERGWEWEGVGWVAPSQGAPVYRLFNPYSDEHLYTIKQEEVDVLVPLGWRYEDIGWYSDVNATVAVLRQFNPYEVTGTHNYTKDVDEDEHLGTLGWIQEGPAWYAANVEVRSIQPFLLTSPDRSGVSQTYWIQSDGSIAKERLINENEAGYLAYATETGAFARDRDLIVGSNMYRADKDGKLTRIVVTYDQVMRHAKEELNKITTASMSKEEKLKVTFEHIRDDFDEYTPRLPHLTDPGWELIYAEDMFVDGGGNCLSYAAAFAFMAKAMGYDKVYAVNSGGHAWAEVDGLVYDPEWARHSDKYTYYGMEYTEECDVMYSVVLNNDQMRTPL